MIWNFLLFPLLGGFWFITKTNHFKFANYLRGDTQRLIYASVTAGVFLFSLCSFLIILLRLLLLALSIYYFNTLASFWDYIAVFIENLTPKAIEQYFPLNVASYLSFVSGFIASNSINLISDVNAQFKNLEKRKELIAKCNENILLLKIQINATESSYCTKIKELDAELEAQESNFKKNPNQNFNFVLESILQQRQLLSGIGKKLSDEKEELKKSLIFS